VNRSERWSLAHSLVNATAALSWSSPAQCGQASNEYSSAPGPILLARAREVAHLHLLSLSKVYVLDEPTSGLHLADVEQLLGLLDRLVDSGKSVIVIAYHLAVMAHADWIIDLGPGAGHDGGRIVFQGTPADLVAARSTLTGQNIAPYVGS
jgi:excinuclease UvrABC ATPase subunit